MSDVTQHAVEEYEPQSRRSGVGLCLSGGGFRATLFHLGAVRRLNELGILQRVTTFSSVSGGSITSALLARVVEWPLTGPIDDFETRVAVPMRAFCATNIRTKPILLAMLPFVTGVDALERAYADHLTKQTLAELPDSPRFVFCSTEMAYGVNFVFEKSQIGDYQVGYVRPAPAGWPVARAVTASSCFPPVFNPLSPDLPPADFKGGKAPLGPDRDACIAKLRLTDGGNYDNMGLEPVWKDHQVVLVSDGGATFDFEGDRDWPHRLLRYTAISDKQAHALRKRWLISSFITRVMEGTYWGISSAISSYGSHADGYSKELAEEIIATVRTDLDAFNVAEASVLENHGYLLADAAIRRHASQLITSDVALAVPHAEWMDEARIRSALAKSGERKFLGRR